MRIFNLLFLWVFIIFSCKEQKKSVKGEVSIYESTTPTQFNIQFGNDVTSQRLIADSLIYGSGCSVNLKTIGGKSALAIKTSNEFSDAFLNLERLLEHPIDFSKARYVSMKLFVPEASWISALKFNFKDADGNFGGCNEIVNNFYTNYDQWFDVVVDMQNHIPNFKNWHGDESPLPQTKFLSLNPYNAHQADSSVIYIHSITLTDAKPTGNFTKALAEKPKITPNRPHTITFNDENLLRKQMAIRAFESTYQAMSINIAGNETMAIRLKGKEGNKHLAFLPILDKMTGDPVDFTEVERIRFSYYLTEDSADFDGACLYLANEHWQSVLYDKTVFTNFKKGVWTDAVINLADINLELVRGEGPVMPNVYEIRLGLNYRPEDIEIEMWLDNFGWE